VSAIPLNAWKVDIYTSQQGLANNHLIRMPVKIAFYNGSHVTEEHSFLIDSLQNHFSIEVALPPTMLAIDRNEEMSDAVVDYEKKIKSTGSHVFLETNCTLVVDQASADSVLVRVEHHFVAPDTLDLPNGITKLSDYHYWTVNGSWDTTFLAKAKFFYDGTTSTTVGYQDNTFITGSENYLRLMYRPNRGSNWTVVDGFTLNKGASTSDKRGNIQVEHLKKGEYCLGWSETMLAVKDKENKKPGFVISPNPTRDILTIDVEKLSHPEEWNVMLVDTQGRMVMQTTLYPHQSFIKLDISQLKAGIYLVKLGNLANQSPLSQRFVKE
ncbi:MAG: T9SS type A sorting domain-containing protein, partial [Bacteroidia bacterium]|nr:T9SS type A sorting domain-containing protein [Bacteroidia bacterium]